MAQNVNSTAPNLLTVASNHATVYPVSLDFIELVPR